MSFDRELFALYDDSLIFLIGGCPEQGELGRSAEKRVCLGLQGEPL